MGETRAPFHTQIESQAICPKTPHLCAPGIALAIYNRAAVFDDELSAIRRALLAAAILGYWQGLAE